MVYITQADIEESYGRPLSDTEIAAVDGVIAACCQRVERLCDGGFDPGPVLDEYHTVEGNQIFLAREIVSVEEIKLRTLMVNSQEVTLTPSEWQILDPRSGRLLINNVIGPVAFVSYTRADPPPAVHKATVLLAGLMLTTTADPNRDADNYSSFQIGRELSVVFRPDSAELPGTVAGLLAPWMARTVVF